MESIPNEESAGCNLDLFLKITAGKLLIRWNWRAEERPRNVTPNPKCLPTKSCRRKGSHGSRLEQENPPACVLH